MQTYNLYFNGKHFAGPAECETVEDAVLHFHTGRDDSPFYQAENETFHLKSGYSMQVTKH